MTISVSVIMYVKNGMPYFERALKSVCDQSLKSIEILVVDGGSSDGTLELVNKYAKNDSRIRVLNCSAGSVGAQFNLGLKEASGKYIGIVESDDYVLPEMYESLYAVAEMHNSDMVRADNYIFWGEQSEEIKIRTNVSSKGDVYGKNISYEENPMTAMIGGSFWTGLYRKDFLMENAIMMNESSGASYQDFGFLFLTSVMARSIYYFKEAFYCYRKDNPNSSCNSPKNRMAVQNEYKFLMAELKKRDMWEKCKDYYLMWFLRNERWFCSCLTEDDRKYHIVDFYNGFVESLLTNEQLPTFFNNKEREMAAAIKSGKNTLRELLIEDNLYYQQMNSFLQTDLSLKRIYIFGAGNVGDIIRLAIEKKKAKPVAFVDNSNSAQGTKKNGLEIISSMDMLVDFSTVILVCSENYAREIRQQLVREGVAENAILVSNSMDMAVKLLINAIDDEKSLMEDVDE